MTLKKTSVFAKSAADPFFNQVAAQKTYDLVMKMDEDSAREFAFHVVNDIVEETIEKNLRSVQKRLDQVVSKRLETVRKSALRAAAQNQDGAVEFAKALTMFSKDNAGKRDFSGADLHRFNAAHPRGEGGRFRTKVRTNDKAAPLRHKHAEALGIPAHPMDSGKNKLKPQDRARYQQEYAQVRDFLNAVHQSTGGDADVLLHVKDKQGRESVVRNSGTRVDPSKWDPNRERITGVDAQANSLNVGGAYFGLSTALGGQPSSNTVRGINAGDKNFNSFASQWTAGGYDAANPNDRMYNRLAAGSQFLGQVAPTSGKAQIAAQLGQFVGSHGPDAERVFGPSARKAAYRYRGTERTPDEQLVRNYSAAVNRGKSESNPARSDSPMQMAAARVMNERRDPSFQELAQGRQAVVEYLNSEGVRPRAGLYNLQLASGTTPPSEGVIINNKGQITTQAVGYGDDHYLPFNLKHLKDLKGGEYLRNRSVGGPTSEDIYTGLMTGARQLTVTSRSGTFTVTFKDDFRGGRRHNDKAKRMVRRYEQILDAVQSNQVDRIDVEPPIRQAITQQVREEFSGPAYTRAEINAEVQRRVDEFKSSPDISEEDEKIAETIINARTQGGTTRDAQQIRRDVYESLAEEKEYKFRLNGLGYSAALSALQEQFPYYISVQADTQRDEEKKRHLRPLSPDRGYVEPGRNRPTAARAGLFGTETNRGQKISASQADYQGSRAERRGGTPDGTGTEEKAAAPAAETAKPKSAESQIKEMQNTAKYAEAAVSLRSAIKEVANEPPNTAWWGLPDDQFSLWLEKPDNQREFHTFVTTYENKSTTPGGQSRPGLNEFPAVQGPLANYKLSSGWVGRKNYEPSLRQQWNAQPFAFEGEAYSQGASREQADKELTKIGGTVHGVVNNKPLSDMSDGELHAEVEAVAVMRRTIGDRDTLSLAEKKALMPGLNMDSPSMSVMQNAKSMDAYLEKVHRVRALNAVRGAAPTRPEPVVVDNGPARTSQPNAWKTSVMNEVQQAKTALENDPDSDEVELARVKRFEESLDTAEFDSQSDIDSFTANNSRDFDTVMRTAHRYRGLNAQSVSPGQPNRGS